MRSFRILNGGRGNLLGISISLSAPFIRRLCMKLSMENWIRIDASSNRTRLWLFISWRNLRADEGMQGLRTWEEDSLGVDDSITNYTLHPPFLFFFFLLKEKNLIATRSGVRWYIYANCYRTFWKAVKCKIRYGIRLHLLVTRIYGATFLAVCVIELFLRLVTCMILNLCVNEISHEYINYGEKYRKKRTSKNKLKLYLIFFLFLHEMRRK